MRETGKNLFKTPDILTIAFSLIFVGIIERSKLSAVSHLETFEIHLTE